MQLGAGQRARRLGCCDGSKTEQPEYALRAVAELSLLWLDPQPKGDDGELEYGRAVT